MYCKRLYHETWYLVISILKPWVSCATDSFTHIVTVCSFIIFRSSNSCIVNNSTIKPGIRRHRYLSLVFFSTDFFTNTVIVLSLIIPRMFQMAKPPRVASFMLCCFDHNCITFNLCVCLWEVVYGTGTLLLILSHSWHPLSVSLQT